MRRGADHESGQSARIIIPAGRALGIDWSGAIRAGEKIWAASVLFNAAGSCRLEYVRRPFRETQMAILALSAYFPETGRAKGWNAPPVTQLSLL